MPSSNSPHTTTLTPGGLSLRPASACRAAAGPVESKSIVDCLKPCDAARLAARRTYLETFIPQSAVFHRAQLRLVAHVQHDKDSPTHHGLLQSPSPFATDAQQPVTEVKEVKEGGGRSFCTQLDDWLELGNILESALGMRDDVRVYHYYLPIFFWVMKQLAQHNHHAVQKNGRRRPLVLGLSCPQGGGKTTLTVFLQRLLRAVGRNVNIASIDDFYHTYDTQCAIAQQNEGNRLLQFRGMPGTHDMPLLTSVLDRIADGAPVCIPAYDKTAHGGRGDRASRDRWTQTVAGADVVLLEGWCLGFEPARAQSLHDDALKVIDQALTQFQHVYDRLDGLMLVEIEDMEWVYDWRLQAERETRAAGRPGLTDDQVVDFVDRFMPAYRQYSLPLYHRQQPLFPGCELHIEIDRQRRPVSH